MDKYNSDKPINSGEEDLYNRTSFANHVVKVLAGLDKSENLVVGLYAKWGFGKTSTVNLIMEGLDKEKHLHSIYLNAWALEGDSSSIHWEVLSQTYLALSSKEFKSVSSSVGKVVELLPIKVEFSGVSISAEEISKKLVSFDGLKRLKKAISSELESADKKIVVFLDDIDRLNSQQITEVFRMMHALADYGGVTYVLPFDKEYVCDAIGEHLPRNQNGADYIEKIIQVPLHLPAIPQYTIDKVFIAMLGELLDQCMITVVDDEAERFRTLYYYNGANSYIQSPRDVKKILNALRFILPINHGEANIVDTIIIEILKVFDKPFYERIKANKKLLVKTGGYPSIERFLFDKSNEKRRADYEAVFAIDNNSYHHSIAKALFPDVESLYDSSQYCDNDSLRKAQRIASEHYFDYFFTSTYAENGISNREIMRLLSNTREKETIDKNLQIVDSVNFEFALRIIRDKKNLIENKLDFCCSLLDLSESLSGLTESFLTLDPLRKVLSSIDDILRDSPTKLNDYTYMLRYTYNHDRVKTVPYLIRQVVIYGNSKKRREGIILNDEEKVTYQKAALSVIQEIAKNNGIPVGEKEDDEGHLYQYWADFGSTKEVFDYTSTRIKSATAAIDFISMFLAKWSAVGASKNHRGDLDKATFKMIGRFIEPDYCYQLIVKDKQFEKFKGVLDSEVLSLRKDEFNGLSAVGNEHTDEFRAVVASRFIFFYENTKPDEDISSSIV